MYISIYGREPFPNLFFFLFLFLISFSSFSRSLIGNLLSSLYFLVRLAQAKKKLGYEVYDIPAIFKRIGECFFGPMYRRSWEKKNKRFRNDDYGVDKGTFAHLEKKERIIKQTKIPRERAYGSEAFHNRRGKRWKRKEKKKVEKKRTAFSSFRREISLLLTSFESSYMHFLLI